MTTQTAALQTSAPIDIAWLRSRPFDLTLIFGGALIALTAGLVSTAHPALFPVILWLDLWLLGYHHVVSTYTRLCFDMQSFKEHRFFIVWLPIIVLAIVFQVAFIFGPWTIATVYLYWQWLHYTRQSYGLERIYNRKSHGGTVVPDRLTYLMIYLVPLWGILHRSAGRPEMFLGMPIRAIPVPVPLANAVGVIALACIVIWMIRFVPRVLADRRELSPFMYVVSHLAIFTTGYVLIPDINYGWLVLNIWHNIQYILIVWMYNTNRFKGGVTEEHRLLSTLSQSKNWPIYFFVCFAASTIAYTSVETGLKAFSDFLPQTLPLALVVYAAINFHHYIVDGVIWKVRKRSVQENLGIQPI
jgi:hypothetical protein